MAKQAYLKVEQSAHEVPTPQRQVHYGCFRFCVSLYFDGLSKWLIGRSPDTSLVFSSDNIYCIYIPSILLTRNLCTIHASKSVYDDLHIIEPISEKQKLINSMTGLFVAKKPLKDGDSFQVDGLPFIKFKYVVINDNDSSGDISSAKNTVY